MTDLDRDEIIRLNETVGKVLGWERLHCCDSIAGYVPVDEGQEQDAWGSDASEFGSWDIHELPPADVVFGDALQALIHRCFAPCLLVDNRERWIFASINACGDIEVEASGNDASEQGMRLAVMRAAAEVLG